MHPLRWLLVTGFAALLLLTFFTGTVPAPRAAQNPDPNLVWSIGTQDDSGDEFAPGAAAEVTYLAGQSDPRAEWREKQNAADASPPVYRIRFRLDGAVAPGYELALDYYFLSIAPRALEVVVNGKRGRFRILPVAARNLDERQSASMNYSRQSLRVPLAASLLRAGENQIALAFLGEGGIANWDSLALRKAGPAPDLAATVEPTIFFRMRAGALHEVVQVVVHHSQPIGAAQATLKAGEAAVSGKAGGESLDFGEQVVELDFPARSTPAPYQLAVNAAGRVSRFHGEFRPEKRWRIFAGLKIHNDIGYTDLQPHVQELDNRNTDKLLELIARFPFYKFNLETGWLVENYLASRGPERRRQLLALAARNQVGINALYLNLMSGMATGEEMFRALYYSKSLSRKYGIPLKFACLTDTPSHTVFLPSLLADAGVTGFALGSNQTRGALLQNSNLNEDSPFYWEGVDGRRVLAWFARSYLQLHRLLGDQPSVDRLRRTLPTFLARYRRPAYPVDSVLLYGLYTDNASIQEGEAALIEKWNQTYAYPKLIASTDADYYDHLTRNFASKLPVYKGDGGAYWEDGAGSTALETILNRDSQRLLPAAETAAALASAFRPAETYPAGEFREAWKNLMFYDEHTWGASRSISQPERRLVTDQWDFKRAYAWRAHWAAKDLLYRSLNRLVQNVSVDGPTLFVFNPNLHPRTDLARLELDGRRQVVDLKTGRPVECEVVAEKDGYQVLEFLAQNVPGMGYRAYGIRSGEARRARPPNRDSWEIESRFYRLRIDPATGAIAELIDKQLGRNLADSGAAYHLNELLCVQGGEKSRILQDLLTLRPPQLAVQRPHTARLVENTGKRIRVRARAVMFPEIETEIALYDTVKRVDIVNKLNKTETRAKEAVYFAYPFRMSPPELAYQVQNAWIRPDADQLPGACRDWFTTQNLVVARDAGAAVAWATPDAPLITLTDINRGLWLKQRDVRNAHVYAYVMNNYWFTNYKAAQGGEFTFRFAMTSGAALDDAELARFDSDTRSPLVAYDYYETGNVRIQPVRRPMPLAEGAFLQVEAAHAQVTGFKPAEDGNGFILRLRETAGRQGTARVSTPAFSLSSGWLANGVEDNLSPLAVKAGAVEAPLKPRQFTTLRLVLGARASAGARPGKP